MLLMVIYAYSAYVYVCFDLFVLRVVCCLLFVLRVVAWLVLLVCMPVVCIGVVLQFGTCTSSPSFTYAGIAHTFDRLGFDSTPLVRLKWYLCQPRCRKP